MSLGLVDLCVHRNLLFERTAAKKRFSLTNLSKPQKKAATMVSRTVLKHAKPVNVHNQQ